MAARYLTVAQTAELIHKSEASVRRRIRQGRIKAFNQGTPRHPDYLVFAAQFPTAA